MSKLGKIQAVIAGKHCMGADGLTDYYAAKAVRDAGRIRDAHKRFRTIQAALKNYQVNVTWAAICEGEVRIRDNASNVEIYV